MSKKGKSGRTPVQKPTAPEEAAPAIQTRLDARTVAILALAFLSGGALMTLEIVGGRIIAAHLGSHVFVWGAVIGVFMGSLSLGYFAGGKLADRFPRTWLAGAVTFTAGLAVLLVPLLSTPVCRAVTGFFFTGNIDLSARWNPLIAVLVLFLAPAAILGAISPIAIRLLALETRSLGRLAGRIYALNALGSILGTLVTAFILMGFLGNTAILAANGVMLLFVGTAIAAMDRFSALFGKLEEKKCNKIPLPGTN